MANELYKLNIEDYKAYKNQGYITRSIYDKNIICGFLPNHGTTLYYYKVHFIVVDNNGNEVKIK